MYTNRNTDRWGDWRPTRGQQIVDAINVRTDSIANRPIELNEQTSLIGKDKGANTRLCARV